MWKNFNQRNHPIAHLAELVLNEGIAYYISMQQQSQGSAPSPSWFAQTKRAMGTLDNVFTELASPSLSYERARELIMNSNLSGSFEKNYGATAGLFIAYTIDTKLGRQALTDGIQNGVGDFFEKYDALCTQYGGLPKFSDTALAELKKWY